MKRDTLMAVALLSLSAMFFSARRLLGVEIAPASASDIINALGPDASGLHLSQDTLPDLFTLTASRIEENPQQFTVEQPYLSGRWKGGKAVIEYARDLSYTIVSIYDRNGHRQRIYSVTTAFNTHAPQNVAAAPASEAPQEGWGQEAPPESARESRTASAPAVASAGGPVSFEWDESKGAYRPAAVAVPIASSEGAPEAAAPAAQASRASAGSEAPSTHRHRRHHREGELSVASAQTFTPAPAKKTGYPAPMQDAGVWIPAGEKSKSSHKTSSREAVKAGNATWVEHREKASPEESAPHKRRKKAKSESGETQVAMAPPPKGGGVAPSAEASKASDEWVPKSMQESSSKEKSETASKRAVESEVPSTEELISGASPASNARPSSESAPAEKPAHRRRKRAAPEEQAAPPLAAVAEAPAPPPTVSRAAEVRSAASKPAEEPAPAAEELVSKSESKTGPDTSDSDHWVPKEAPRQAAKEPEIQAEAQPTQVAMLPKSAPVDNSVDHLLKMANEGKEEMPQESDHWVPKKTAATSQEAEINKEIARVKAEEKKEAAPVAKVVQIRHDVNNPEEGVLPVSSFEKFSGPMYGRHREYERRFYPGKKSNGRAPEHDFYVDEVDRKKEIHNIYYYLHQKGKAPRLVAVERHDKVSFMGNYDIDKEDKGKITTYN